MLQLTFQHAKADCKFFAPILTENAFFLDSNALLSNLRTTNCFSKTEFFEKVSFGVDIAFVLNLKKAFLNGNVVNLYNIKSLLLSIDFLAAFILVYKQSRK